MEQGKTEPWLCRAENDRLYVAKGRSALISGCIKELICAQLGRGFGLPIPAFELLEIPIDLLAMDSRYPRELGEQPLFGSEYQDFLEEFNRTFLRVIDPQLLRDLFLFDYWIKNEDRTFTANGGNPNVFYRNSDHCVAVIDHNLAFDPDFNVGGFRNLHLGRDAWYDGTILGLRVGEYQEKMASVMEKFDGYCHNLPPEWRQDESIAPDFLDRIKSQLLEFTEDYFWEPIT